jgi:hypothetical protein
VLSYVATQGKDCREVYLQHAAPVIIWELGCWMARLNSGAVEEDADFVFVGQYFGNQG